MYAAYLVVALVTAVANVFSGLGAVARLGPIGPAMERVGVPRTWLVFPIGTLKLAGAVGLLLGLAGLPLVGTAAAAGLVLYFSGAVYTHRWPATTARSSGWPWDSWRWPSRPWGSASRRRRRAPPGEPVVGRAMRCWRAPGGSAWSAG